MSCSRSGRSRSSSAAVVAPLRFGPVEWLWRCLTYLERAAKRHRGAVGRCISLALLLANLWAQERSRRSRAAAGAVRNAFGGSSAHGERLASILGCRGCHGDALTGEAWGKDAREAILFTSNLRRAVRGYSDAALERAVRGGVRPDGSPLWDMPSEIFAELAAGDMAAIIAFLRALPPAGADHPRPAFARRTRAIAAGEWKSAAGASADRPRQRSPALDGRHDLARYMIRATCSECHRLDLTGLKSRKASADRPIWSSPARYARTVPPSDAYRLCSRAGAISPDGAGRARPLRPYDSAGDRRDLRYLVARAARPQTLARLRCALVSIELISGREI